MRKIWFDAAWDDYLYWQANDKRILKKINAILKNIERGGYQEKGLGKPERLKGNLSGFLSSRLGEEHRLVYRVRGDTIEIVSCRGHYN